MCLITLFYLPSSARSSYSNIQSIKTENPDEMVEAQQHTHNTNNLEDFFYSDEKKDKNLSLVKENSKQHIRRKAQLTLCGVVCSSNPECRNSGDSCVWCGKQFLLCSPSEKLKKTNSFMILSPLTSTKLFCMHIKFKAPARLRPYVELPAPPTTIAMQHQTVVIPVVSPTYSKCIH
jgi:hypothetical protein